MIRRYNETFEAPATIYKIIEENEKDLNNTRNYIVELLIISLSFLINKRPTNTIPLIDFAKSIVISNGCSNTKYIKNSIKNVINISKKLGENLNFMEETGKEIANNLKNIKDNFEDIYNFITANKEDFGSLISKDFDEFFTKEVFSVSIELYYILKDIDLESIITDYNNKDPYISFIILTQIVNPLVSSLEDALIEKKAMLYDLMHEKFSA